MKKNDFKTIAITGILIGLGTVALHGAMVFAQSRVIQTNIKVEEQNVKEEERNVKLDTDKSTTEKEAEGVIETEVAGIKETADTYDWNGFSISFIVYEGATQIRKAEDMKAEEALKIALNKIEEIYQIKLHGNAVKMTFEKTVESNNYSNSKNANIRYYEGYINYSEKLDYGFEVNSVTGEILVIAKFNSEETDFDDKSILYDRYTKEELAKVEDEYYNLAENFVNEYVDKGKVTKVYGLCAGDVNKRIGMYAYCETTEGDTIYIAIDQETKEMLMYQVNPIFM